MPATKKPIRPTGVIPGAHAPHAGYISTLQAARMCGVSVFSIQRWFDEGLLIGATLPGGRRRIASASLEAFMKKHIITATGASEADATRILLVDDDARLLSVMRESLEGHGGCLVRAAASGLEAGLALSEFRPEVIVLDVLLEDVPGQILVKRIRESQAGRTVRIVAISGKASEADERGIQQAGANAFLRKPFTMADLVKAIGLRKPAKHS